MGPHYSFYLPKEKVLMGQGRPTQHPPRLIFEAIAHTFHSGCSWKGLPSIYPPYQTIYRPLQKWWEAGVFLKIAQVLVAKLFDLGKRKPDKTF